ncbi:hypothetical protein ACEWY4_001882 [Coilia grayii]|uniref:Hyaluronidase n=1 Tax=Coilia grayii TaxID=363190 RepID=A0ABD1KU72_9TELE
MGWSSHKIRSWVVSLLVILCISRLDSLSPEPPRPPTEPPIFDGEPFIVSWNIPNLTCNRYNITLNTSPYRGVSNPAKVPGQFLSLFYIDRLGLYPYVDQATKKQFNGGVPQRGNLRVSLAKAHDDIHYYIPSRSSPGLAVIDWEEWRPLWERNWGSKQIYRSLSVTLRPAYRWGFYLFPNCYNYGWAEPGYTGECPWDVQRQNNRLLWLWEASTALYPSIYLQASLADSPNAALMVRHRVHEALRVAALPRRRTLHGAHIRRDLIHTIGESAAIGASGAVLWGSSSDYDDKGKGRCVRRNYTSGAYLHLSPDSFTIYRSEITGGAHGRGGTQSPGPDGICQGFTCQCYAGLSCDTNIPIPTPTPTEKTTTTTTTTVATTTTNAVTSTSSPSISPAADSPPRPTSDESLGQIYSTVSTQTTDTVPSTQSQTEDFPSSGTRTSDYI